MGVRFQSIYFDDPPCLERVMDLFVPAADRRPTALLFVHGGGWRGGSRQRYHALVHAFRDKGYICAATDYRLHNVNILDQLADVRTAYCLLCDELKRLGFPQRIAVMGGSAGAHLAALLALAPAGACGETAPAGFAASAPPAALIVSACPVTFEPWEDIFPPIWASMQDIVGCGYESAPERYRAVSPIEHLSPKSPPILFLHAQNEHMFRREAAERFVAQARSLGRPATLLEYPHAEHGFFYDVTRKVQRAAFKDVLKFLAALDECSIAEPRLERTVLAKPLRAVVSAG